MTSTSPDATGRTAETTSVDVVIVGGGAAGLSAAVALGRSLRSVIVVDAGEPRNAPAGGAHNLLGREGIAPAELLTLGRAEAHSYGAQILSGTVTAVHRREEPDLQGPDDHPFTVTVDSGEIVTARRIILASGLVDELPDIDGITALWGRDVLHCPYCHGYEVRGTRIAVLGTGPMAMHQAMLFAQLSDDVTLIVHDMSALSAEQQAQAHALGVRVVDGPVTRLATDNDDRLRAAVLADGTEIAIDALAVAPRFVARAAEYESLGGELTDHPMGRFIPTEMGGRTAIPGVWAAGNAADMMAMVGAAAAAGVFAGAGVNADLAEADMRAAMAAVVS